MQCLLSFSREIDFTTAHFASPWIRLFLSLLSSSGGCHASPWPINHRGDARERERERACCMRGQEQTHIQKHTHQRYQSDVKWCHLQQGEHWVTLLQSVIHQDTVTRPSGLVEPPQGIKTVCEVSRLSYTSRCDITAGCWDNKPGLPGSLRELSPTELKLSKMSFLGCGC